MPQELDPSWHLETAWGKNGTCFPMFEDVPEGQAAQGYVDAEWLAANAPDWPQPWWNFTLGDDNNIPYRGEAEYYPFNGYWPGGPGKFSPAPYLPGSKAERNCSYGAVITGYGKAVDPDVVRAVEEEYYDKAMCLISHKVWGSVVAFARGTVNHLPWRKLWFPTLPMIANAYVGLASDEGVFMEWPPEVSLETMPCLVANFWDASFDRGFCGPLPEACWAFDVIFREGNVSATAPFEIGPLAPPTPTPTEQIGYLSMSVGRRLQGVRVDDKPCPKCQNLLDPPPTPTPVYKPFEDPDEMPELRVIGAPGRRNCVPDLYNTLDVTRLQYFANIQARPGAYNFTRYEDPPIGLIPAMMGTLEMGTLDMGRLDMVSAGRRRLSEACHGDKECEEARGVLLDVPAL